MEGHRSAGSGRNADRMSGGPAGAAVRVTLTEVIPRRLTVRALHPYGAAERVGRGMSFSRAG